MIFFPTILILLAIQLVFQCPTQLTKLFEVMAIKRMYQAIKARNCTRMVVSLDPTTN